MTPFLSATDSELQTTHCTAANAQIISTANSFK